MKRDYFPTNGWKMSSKNIPEKHILNLEEAIKNEFNNMAGIVIIKDGYLIYENYYNNHNKDEAIPVASVTKSVISSLYGIALKNGDIRSLEEKALYYFPEYKTNNRIKRDVRLKDLITMSAPFPFKPNREPIDKLVTSSNWMNYSLDFLANGADKKHFKYSTIGTHLMSGILTNATGLTARKYANIELFSKLGMKVIPNYKMEGYEFDDLFGYRVKGWLHDPQHYSLGGWGLTFTPRDMAKFGFLYLNNGIWNNEQIFPNNWVEESTTKQKYDYGYLWWLFNSEDIKAYCAMGIGGNCICVVPELDLVVAITSDYIKNPRNRWSLIKKYIIPIFI